MTTKDISKSEKEMLIARPITNKYYKERPWLEKMEAFYGYMTINCLSSLGGNFFCW